MWSHGQALLVSGLAMAYALALACGLAPARAGAEGVAAAPASGAPAPAAPSAASPSARSGNPLPAVWKERHVSFTYVGRTARYSCDGLRDKVRAMLLDLGARRDARLVAIGCADDGRPPVHAMPLSIDITFSAPALPDNAAKPLHLGDLAATDARFEPFTIASDAFRNMGIGDCELVEEFTRQILPRLATRDVKRDITCVPYQQSGSRFLVQGEILKTLPRAEQTVDQRQLKAR